MKKFFTFSLAIFCTLSMLGKQLEVQGIYYNVLSDSTLEVAIQPVWSSPSDCLTYAHIPSVIEYNKTRYTIVSIADSSFYEYPTLEFLHIPTTVINIGTRAFQGCPLTSVVSDAIDIPSMGEDVFANLSLSDAILYVPEEVLMDYKSAEQWKKFGAILPINTMAIDKNRFPMLSGLQRTSYIEHTAECESSTLDWMHNDTNIVVTNGNAYLKYGDFYLREDNNKILILAVQLQKDLVLYDFTLEVGDTLTTLNVMPAYFTDRMDVYDFPVPEQNTTGLVLVNIDTLTVTNVSAITLLDGKEYKKWTFNNGMEYAEGIGSLSGDFFQLINQKRYNTCPHNNHLVCASQNGVMLYQMDDAAIDRLGAECLCEGYVGTSVETIITPNTNASKLIQDGQLFILRDGKTYNVMGIEVK